jgi:uroporphyrinogen decarboxylase
VNPACSSRERVLRAIQHVEPDRVPLHYFDNPALRKRMAAHFGISPDDNDAIFECLDIDFRGIWLPYIGPRLHAEIPGREVDPAWGRRKRWIANEFGGYWDFCDFPLLDASAEAFDSYPMPSPDDYDYGIVDHVCSKHPDKAIYIGGPGSADILNFSGMVMGVEQTMMEIIDPDSPLQRFIDRRIDIQLAELDRTLTLAKGRVDILWIGEDLGTQRGPIISMNTYRRFIKPRHMRFIDLAKSWNIPVMIHSCGSSSWGFDEFIDMGISMIDTLQPEAANMSPAYLKSKWGDKLTFHGCISTAGPVAYRTPEEVRANVRETLETMKPNGGYCLAPTHCLQDNSPTENVLAMYEAAREFGGY